MDEERKPEESLMSDETLFFGYAKAIAGGNQAARIREDTAWIADSASKMVNQHRKLFPKKIKHSVWSHKEYPKNISGVPGFMVCRNCGKEAGSHKGNLQGNEFPKCPL